MRNLLAVLLCLLSACGAPIDPPVEAPPKLGDPCPVDGDAMCIDNQQALCDWGGAKFTWQFEQWAVMEFHSCKR